MRLKVSNVCQLLDKSKYPATQTINGVTFTNNGDGTITANGTATGLCQYRITNSYKKLIGENTNKCLLVGSISANSGTPYYLQLDFVEGNSWSRAALDFGKGVIFTNSDSSTQLLSIIVKSGVTVNNLVFKPQLFDLTEMYGAGNEPTTVAQFRQDFPNEMYEYSPVCWKKFSRLKYITETKNLFDINKVVETVHVKRSGDGLICSSYGTSIGKLGTICPSLKVGDTVTVSFKTVSEGVKSNFIQTDNHILRNGEKFTVSETGLTSQFYLYNTSYDCRDIPNKTTYYELQLELGSTATPYQPYGYLPLNRGKYIANKEPVQLFDKSKYRVSSTVEGITFTNNGDGTWTVVGTAPDVPANKQYVSKNIITWNLEFSKKHFIPGHKIVVAGGVSIDSAGKVADVQWVWGWTGGYDAANSWERTVHTIKQYPEDKLLEWSNYIELRVYAGATVNFTFKPQFFDLTEMYGAGNEPTTVEQFRADFPNELYDYNLYNAITFR